MSKHAFIALAPALAPALAAALALAPLGQASAQGIPFCDGRVQASQFSSSAAGGRLTYWVSIDNIVGDSLAIEVSFRDTRNVMIAGSTGPVARRLAGFSGTGPIQLGVMPLGHPAAPNGLSVPSDLAAGTRVTCRTVTTSRS